jgi:hypothetical protein
MPPELAPFYVAHARWSCQVPLPNPRIYQHQPMYAGKTLGWTGLAAHGYNRWSRWNLGADHVRRLTATAVAGMCVLAAACESQSNKLSASTPPSAKAGSGHSTSSTPPPPVAVSALDGLLLSPDQVNTAMGASGMTVT